MALLPLSITIPSLTDITTQVQSIGLNDGSTFLIFNNSQSIMEVFIDTDGTTPPTAGDISDGIQVMPSRAESIQFSPAYKYHVAPTSDNITGHERIKLYIDRIGTTSSVTVQEPLTTTLQGVGLTGNALNVFPTQPLSVQASTDLPVALTGVGITGTSLNVKVLEPLNVVTQNPVTVNASSDLPVSLTGVGITGNSLNVVTQSSINVTTPSPIDVNIDAVDEISGALRTISGYGDLSKDAYGHQKISQDITLFSSAFTFNVDRNLWIPFENSTEIYSDLSLTKIGSLNGKLNMSSGATIGNNAYIESRRHPRYQPNRGHLYSASLFLPNKAAIGVREFGIFNSFGGVFFRLQDGVLYAVVRTTINTVTSEPFTQIIDLVDLGLSAVDLEKGNSYDIQMQWRGVGNVYWYISDPATGHSKLVATYNYLNTGVELSTFNPALPVRYYCENTNGTNVTIQSGCVDVSCEQGIRGNRSYAATTSGEQALSNQEVGILAMRVPKLFNGTTNSRDLAITRFTGYTDDNALIRVYYFRDPTAITATFTNIRSGFQQQATRTAITAINTAQMIKLFEARIPSNGSKEYSNPDKDNGDFHLVAGDYLLITMQAKNQSQGGVGLEWSEYI